MAYIIAIMFMILHGIEAPNILHTNTLAENLADIRERDRHDVILANPVRRQNAPRCRARSTPVKQFPVPSALHQDASGRRPLAWLSRHLPVQHRQRVDRLRKMQSCNLHTVLDCPGGTFQGAGVKTVVLFFEKGRPTKKIWYYQLEPGRNLGKTNPLNDDDLAEFVRLQATFADSPKSWTIDAATIDQTTLTIVKNPNGGARRSSTGAQPPSLTNRRP